MSKVEIPVFEVSFVVLLSSSEWRNNGHFILQAGVKRKAEEEGKGSPAEMARAFLEQTLGNMGPKKAK
jgi:hypothetical protein